MGDAKTIMSSLNQTDTQQTHSFGLGVTDPEGFGCGLFGLQFHQIITKVIENLQSAIQHRKTQEMVLMEDRDTEEILVMSSGYFQ